MRYNQTKHACSIAGFNYRIIYEAWVDRSGDPPAPPMSRAPDRMNFTGCTKQILLLGTVGCQRPRPSEKERRLCMHAIYGMAWCW